MREHKAKKMIKNIILDDETKVFAEKAAFPAQFGGTTHGLNTLQYFAAHAPEPPNWFKPVMPPIITIPIGVNDSIQDETIKKVYNEFYDEDADPGNEWLDEQYNKSNKTISGIPLDIKKTIEALINKHKEQYLKSEEWQINNKIQTITQWRFFYAAEMIKTFANITR